MVGEGEAVAVFRVVNVEVKKIVPEVDVAVLSDGTVTNSVSATEVSNVIGTCRGN